MMKYHQLKKSNCWNQFPCWKSVSQLQPLSLC